MSAAKVASDGTITQLGPKAGADEVVSAEDVQDPVKLSKLATRLLATQAKLRQEWAPRRLDYEDVPCDGAGGAITLQHNLTGRVRWWVVDWTSSGAVSPTLITGVETDSATLVLYSYAAGTATIRVEESG